MYDIVENVFSEKPKEIFNWGDDYFTSKFYSFLKFLDSFVELLASPEDQEITEEDIDLANCPLVLGSTKKLGRPVRLSCHEEPREEVIGQHMLLGRDIDVVFTNRESMDTVQKLVRRYGLDTSVAVESFDVLEAASQMDRDLGPYFYDYYNQKKMG